MSRSKCDSCGKPLYGLIPCPSCRERIIDKAVEPWRAFVEEFISWADDGEGDDDGLIARARKLVPERGGSE